MIFTIVLMTRAFREKKEMRERNSYNMVSSSVQEYLIGKFPTYEFIIRN